MIADVDLTIAAWLQRFVPKAGIVFAPVPTPDRPAKRGSVTLALVLVDIGEDPSCGEPGWSSVRDATGVMIGRGAPTRSYRLTYLIVPTAADPLDEHRLLGQVLAGSQLEELVPQDLLVGDLAAVQARVTARCAPHTRIVDPSVLWGPWGISPRASLELTVVAPLPQQLVQDVASPPSSVDLGVGRLPAHPRQADSVPRRARVKARISEE